MSKPTVTDYIAKDNKKLSFEERAKKFEEGIKVLSEELGVSHAAVLQTMPNALVAVPSMHDLWQKTE